MTKITVYHFEVWDPVNDQMVRSKRMGTPDAIKNTVHGREVGQGIDVDVADVGTEIAGFTVRNYRPPWSPSAMTNPPPSLLAASCSGPSPGCGFSR